MLNRKELNALVIRIVVTGVQGFLAVWATSGYKTDKVAIGAAVAAGASLVYNLVLKPQLERLKSVSGA